MKHPLSRFAPSPSLNSLRESGGGRPQCTQAKRRVRGLAALALALARWPRSCQFRWPRVVHGTFTAGVEMV